MRVAIVQYAHESATKKLGETRSLARILGGRLSTRSSVHAMIRIQGLRAELRRAS